jgi:hypothetical protein
VRGYKPCLAVSDAQLFDVRLLTRILKGDRTVTLAVEELPDKRVL